MEAVSPTVPTQALEATTMAEAFRQTAERVPNRVAVRLKDDSISITWAELRDRVDGLARGLHELGLRHGETIALMIDNRPEFHVCDLAAMMIGATPFSIYQTAAPEQIAYVVSDAGAKIAIVEQKYLDRFVEASADLPQLETLVVIDAGGDLPEGARRLEDVEAMESDFDVEESWKAISPEDMLTLIYTSGTTGPPKGVQLTHANLITAISAIRELVQFPDQSRVISWLPSAHIAERAAHHYIPIAFGFTVTCCEDPRNVMAYLPEVRPQWFFAVPRIWEKLKAGLDTMIAGLPDEQRDEAQATIQAAIDKVRLEQAGEEVPAELAEQVTKADETMFAGLRARLGLDQVVTVNVGAAPTPVEVLEFFHAIGIPLAEIWGMSETCGAGTVNPPGKVKIGTVGPASPGIEIKLAEDGEVLLRGGVVMAGYRNQPEKTAETIDSDGWLHTGDIGELDEDGYLKIVDRKKELIINAAGKNMSPANIEATLKSASPLIGQVACIGDRRSYNTALIVLDADFAPPWAKQQGIEDNSLEALATEDRVREELQLAVDQANAKLARVEQIKKFTIVRGDWLPGGDELTPTMKLKRKPIEQKYDAEIEGMYS
ncbi:MAG TPA: long-chain fatty acid--CoA ligase [Solirubrobacteraceae bacterium]|nr:long-chain fatty acid--CoA ligase [Solirubrobacteraceae bacterium]